MFSPDTALHRYNLRLTLPLPHHLRASFPLLICISICPLVLWLHNTRATASVGPQIGRGVKPVRRWSPRRHNSDKTLGGWSSRDWPHALPTHPTHHIRPAHGMASWGEPASPFIYQYTLNRTGKQLGYPRVASMRRYLKVAIRSVIICL